MSMDAFVKYTRVKSPRFQTVQFHDEMDIVPIIDWLGEAFVAVVSEGIGLRVVSDNYYTGSRATCDTETNVPVQPNLAIVYRNMVYHSSDCDPTKGNDVYYGTITMDSWVVRDDKGRYRVFKDIEELQNELEFLM